MKYQVIYASKTGNTQQVADEIYDALPGEDKQIISVEEFDPQREADVFFDEKHHFFPFLPIVFC